MERDIIHNYNELRNDLERYVANHVPWKLIIGEDCVCFYIIDIDNTNTLRLRVSIRVRNDLLVEVHRQRCVLSKRSLSWIVGKENKLEHWSQLDTLLIHFSSEHSDSDVSISSYVESVDCLLEEVYKRVRKSDKEQYGYLKSLNKGSLKWPTELLVEVVTQVFIVFNCLVSAKYESLFLSLTSSQKSVLVKLSMDQLNFLSFLTGIDDCVCLTTASDLFESAVVYYC